ncbi:uncharacterized protein [Spinacia oleracea]|uniref:Retrotransposon gag domain-containing protein n=1 Tax=Spinacia oleracea TaxID=3562 RepID=A0ABM3QWW0_SPIOL|nr:uncharacterized protein LOC130462894 [Spinacia oleracea]
MATGEMTLAEMKAAYEQAQAELAQERASIENLQKELDSVKSSKYQSRYKAGGKPRKLTFEMPDDFEDLTDDEEPRDEEDGSTPDSVTQRLNKMDARMTKHYSRLMKLMIKLPGAPTPVETELTDGYAASPFCEAIARVTVPHTLQLPTWTTLYDGTSDPYPHVNFYKQRMWQIGIPYNLVEPVMCKSFGGTLDGAALEWLMNVAPGSISCPSDLINAFYQQFASSRQLEKQTSDLYRLVQGPTESVRDYFNRFNCEKISIKNCDVRTAIEAFKRGLIPNSELYREITKYPCATFKEVRSRATAQMRIEDDEVIRTASQRSTGGSSDRRSYTPRSSSWRHQPYNRQNQVQNVNQYDDANNVYMNERVVYPPISEYGFNVDIGGVVNALQNVGGTVRWPKKSDRPDSMKDMSKWCDFHRDNGHTTEECISLKKEVAYLLKRGHLKELLSDKGKETYNKDSNTQPSPAPGGDPPAPPMFEKVVNVISGSSDICGLTSSAAKKINRGESEVVKEGQTEEEALRLPGGIWRVLAVVQGVTADWQVPFDLSDLMFLYDLALKECCRYTLVMKKGKKNLGIGLAVNDRGWQSRFVYVNKDSLGEKGQFLVERWTMEGKGGFWLKGGRWKVKVRDVNEPSRAEYLVVRARLDNKFSSSSSSRA